MPTFLTEYCDVIAKQVLGIGKVTISLWHFVLLPQAACYKGAFHIETFFYRDISKINSPKPCSFMWTSS